MWRTYWVVLSLLLGSAVHAGDLSDLSDEEIREIVETQDLERFKELVGERPAFYPETPGQLEAAIRSKSPRSLKWAREALEGTDPNRPIEAINGLAQRGSADALDLLREFLATADPLKSRHEHLLQAWARVFAEVHGDATADLSQAVASDTTVAPIDRALHVAALRGVERETAIALYRPYLRDQDALVRLAAISVSRIQWDHEMLPTILELENDSDPAVRERARQLSLGLLLFGVDGPRRGGPHGLDIPPGGRDPAGLQAWWDRSEEWNRVQYRLMHGEEPPEFTPPRPIPENAPRVLDGPTPVR